MYNDVIMVWNEIVSAICICLSAAFFSLSLQGQKKITILLVQLIASLLFLANYLFVIQINPSATAGAVVAACEIARLIVFYIVEKNPKFNTPKINLIAGISFSIIVSIATIFAWSGWISIFPLVGGILVSLALGSKNVILIKSAFIVQAACITTYLLMLSLWINATSQAVVFIFGILGIITMIKKAKNTKAQVKPMEQSK